MNRREGLIFAVLSPILSSMATVIASEEIHSNLNPLLFLSITGIIGSVLLFIIIHIVGERITWKKVKSNAHDLIRTISLRGIFGNLFFFVGLGITSGIQAIFFTKMEPYFVLAISWLNGTVKVKARHVALMAMHIVGVFLMVTGGVLQFTFLDVGDVLIILAMLMFALSYKYSARVSTNLGAKASSSLTIGIGALVLLPIALFMSGSHGVTFTLTSWTYSFSYAILFFVFGLSLWFAALKYLKGWIVSALRALGPIVAAPFAYWIFGQTLNHAQIVGGGIILVTAYLISKER